MYAVMRENAFRPDTPAAQEDMREFQQAHAAQPGYIGTVVARTTDGRELTVTLWASARQADAARHALGPIIERRLVPHMTQPSRLVGGGEVVFTDLPLAG